MIQFIKSIMINFAQLLESLEMLMEDRMDFLKQQFKDKISKHILIYDDSEHDQNQLTKILKGQKFFLSGYENIDGNRLNFEIIPIKVNEDSFLSINKCFDEITRC